MDYKDIRDTLPGTWQIVATSFPMWLSGKRLHPTFDYRFITSSTENLSFSDTVRYSTKKGRTKYIRGVDTYNVTNDSFIWRGNGWLRIFKSTWRIIQADDNYLVIKFSRSLVTPPGIDILVRSSDIRAARHQLEQMPSITSILHTHRNIRWIV